MLNPMLFTYSPIDKDIEFDENMKPAQLYTFLRCNQVPERDGKIIKGTV